MDGDVHVHRVMDQLQAIIDTAQGALDELAVAFGPVDVSEFDAPTGGEFVVDETSLKIEAPPMLHVDCENRACHDSHVWQGIEADGVTIVEYWCAGMPF